MHAAGVGQGCWGAQASFRHLPQLDAGGKRGGKGRPSFSQASSLVSGDVEGAKCVCVCVEGVKIWLDLLMFVARDTLLPSPLFIAPKAKPLT